MINIKNLSISYGDTIVQEGLNLEIQDGDYIAIVGGNGSGKTSLLQIILNILNISSGEVSIDGINVDKFKEWNKVGYIPQKSSLNHDIPLSVAEYLKLYTNDYSKLEKLSKEFDIDELLNKKIQKISGGQFQRINVVKSLLNDIDYLILDEPNTSLDVQKREVLYKKLHDLNKLGMTIIVITHNIEEIEDKLHKVYNIENNTLKEVNKNACNYC